MGKIYKTQREEADFLHMYKYTAKHFGKQRMLIQIREVEEAEKFILTNIDAGKIDSDFHSSRFRYITIASSQKIFFERINEDVIIVTAGWSGRQWDKQLKEIEKHAEQQIQRLSDLLTLNSA